MAPGLVQNAIRPAPSRSGAPPPTAGVELVENIKQVNARRGLHFPVSLDGLIGRRKELQEWDRAFDRAQDDSGPGGAQGSSR